MRCDQTDSFAVICRRLKQVVHITFQLPLKIASISQPSAAGTPQALARPYHSGDNTCYSQRVNHVSIHEARARPEGKFQTYYMVSIFSIVKVTAKRNRNWSTTELHLQVTT